ncbi:MAG: Dabb family protein [Planctomycetales bacterium]|jgi:hypothetical protein
MRPTQLFLQSLSCLVLASCISCAPAETPGPAPSSPATVQEDTVQEDTPVTDSTVETSETAEETAPTETAEIAAAETEDHSGQVLRHAVFFSFKETATENDIKGVIAAFAELPSKIKSIIDFQWGTNNSPEEHDDGFTHCFLLTFKDEAGRAEYLPHPDHKAFGDVLRPHNDKVFVIDYWGTPQEKMENELKHAVFFKFKDDASPEAVKEVEEGFAALPSKIDTIKAFEWGKNNSPESHSHDFTHCFMVTFADDAGRAVYLPHADHKAFVEVLKPSLDKVRVLDFTPGE